MNSESFLLLIANSGNTLYFHTDIVSFYIIFSNQVLKSFTRHLIIHLLTICVQTIKFLNLIDKYTVI